MKNLKNTESAQLCFEGCVNLRVAKPIERQALLLHPLHGADLLLLALGELGQVQVQDGEACHETAGCDS